MQRLFAAIKVIPEVKLLSNYRELKSLLHNDKITWVGEQNIHITLKFFGDTPESDIPTIINILSQVASGHHPFVLNLESIGIFGSSYNPRVIWLGIKEPESVNALAEDILNTLDKSGYPRDDQHFRPHLTIGRVKMLKFKKDFQNIINRFKSTYFQEVQVNSFELFESKLTPQGPIYTKLQTFYLGRNG